jgi:hypothetical protein
MQKLKHSILIVIEVVDITINFSEIVGKFILDIGMIVNFLRLSPNFFELLSQIPFFERSVLWSQSHSSISVVSPQSPKRLSDVRASHNPQLLFFFQRIHDHQCSALT